jgi:ATP-binding cassette subfamily B protein
MKNDVPKVGILDILRAYGRGVRPQKGLASYTVFAFLLGNALMIVVPLFYKRFFDVLTNNHPNPEVITALVHIILGVLAVNAAVLVIMRTAFLALNNMESKTMSRLRQMSFEHMIQHSYSFFSNNFTGSLVQRVNRFSRAFERLFDTLVFNAIPLLVSIVGSLTVVWFQKPLIAKLMFGWLAFVMVFNYLFSRWKVKYDIASAKADTLTSGLLADNVTNQNAISLFNNFRREAKYFRETSDAQAAAQRKTWDLSIIADAVQISFMVAIEFIVFYYAIQYWRVGAITIGTFVLIQSYIIGLSNRLWDFGRIVRSVHEAFADAKEMVEILHTPHEVKNLPGAHDLKVTEGAITFAHVSFSFNQTRAVLENLNLDIPGGQKVALIGPSGAGKSTIVKTLLRFYDLTSGEIRIDGQDIKRVTQGSLRENISFVPQDPVLFHRSLLENIRYGRPDATDEEVFEAAKLAHCAEFIEELPQKYETLVGERGVKLSGGERQRVAIARAILKNAPILVLDEATSSLDSHSESLIQDALDKLMEGKTSIVIAHRLSTIRKMDRIVVIENGGVLEDGDHESLSAKEGGLYKKLWDLQAGGFLKEE